MLPIRSIVLALCATVAIAAPLSGTVCPSDGDCPTCYGRETPDLRDIVCNAESAFIVATGVDTDGMSWTSPRRWQDIFGAQGSRYAIEHFPIDERQLDNEADSTCRTYYAKPAYEITKGQAPRRVQTPDVSGFKMNQKCSCIGLIAEAGYAVVAFKNRSVGHSDELASQPLDQDVVVVPLPHGEFKIPSCDAKFAEDKSAISTEKLPAVFSNDEAKQECAQATSCPKCEVVQHPEQLRDICQSTKELMIVKQARSRHDVASQKAPWQMPKIEVYVDKDTSKKGAYEVRTKITPRAEEGCAKPTFRVLTALTDNIDDVFMLKNMQLGEECKCDFIRRDHGFAMIRSERELSKSDVLTDKETIIMLPRGHYVLPQCPREEETQRSDEDDEEKAQCDQPEDSCPVCEEHMSEHELKKSIENDDAYIVKMQTNTHLKKSEDSDEVRCGRAELITVIKGEKQNVNSELSFTLPEKCRCAAMANNGRQFYAVVKKDTVEGERLEKLPLNEKVFIVGHNYRAHNLIQRWLKPESIDEAEDRSSYDGYASYAPSYSAPAYAPAYPAPAYAPAYAAPAYPAPAYAAPAYPAPAYAAPAYPAPAYAAPAYPAPAYAAPAYPAPAYAAPAYPAPAYAAPAYDAPAYPAPAYAAPAYPAPAYAAPAYPAPAYAAPAYPAPAYAAPAYAPVSYAPLYSSSYSYMQAPSYGIDYAPAYPAPAYPAPAYAAPAYPAPAYAAPAYSAPAYSAPAYAAPAYSAPAYAAPAYSAPAYSAPAYAAPAYPAPSYAAPAYPAPSYAAPAYPAPSYAAPAYPAPAYAAPAYPAPSYAAPAYPAPSYAAPAYGYSAPSYGYSPAYGYPAPSYDSYDSYAAPSYPAPSYAAPSYSAPAYPAPSYSAPAYPAPSYSAPAYPAPSYSAPAYPAPSYAAPSYSAPAYPAPSYSAPAYPAPSYPAPSYDAPAYPAPAYSAPAYPAPAYSAPAYSAPAYAAPAYAAPAYAAPSYPAPSYDAPAYPAPSYSAPAYPAPSYSAPSYAAPSYSAPSYSAPSYSAPAYSAPAYAAPAYPAPSYAAPAYSAPSYPAPSYSAPAYAAPAYSAPAYSAPAYAAPSYPAPAYPAPAYSDSYAAPAYDTPKIAVQYSMPITIPIVTAKSTYSKGSGYGYGSSGTYGSDYGKTSGTQIVETKVEATYTTVVGIQPADSYPSSGPTYQPGYQQAPGYAYSP